MWGLNKTIRFRVSVVPLPPTITISRYVSCFRCTITFRFISAVGDVISTPMYSVRLLRKIDVPTKTQWKSYDENTTYPIKEHYSNVDSCIVIPVCTKCKQITNYSLSSSASYPSTNTISTNNADVDSYPQSSYTVLFGRNTGDNPFSEYRILTGDMNFKEYARTKTLLRNHGSFITGRKRLRMVHKRITNCG